MMLLNNDHGHPLPDAPVFYSVLSKNKQELRAAARANRMMKRFHLTIPYIIACLMAYYGFFRYYPQLKTSFLGICILYYAAAYFIRWYLEPQYALFLFRHRPYYLAESDTFLFFTLYGLEDEDGKLTQARDLAVLSWIQRCKKQIPDNSPVLRIIQNRTFKDLEEEMLDTVNKLGIGPGGLGGTTTALAVNVNTYPTHIAGLPVAVNICCHVNRHAVRVL